MSGAGISPLAIYDPADYAKIQAIQRRQALGQGLLEQGQANPGIQPYAGLANAGRSLLGAYLLKKGDSDYANVFNPPPADPDGNAPLPAQAPPQMPSQAPQQGMPTGQVTNAGGPQSP